MTILLACSFHRVNSVRICKILLNTFLICLIWHRSVLSNGLTNDCCWCFMLWEMQGKKNIDWEIHQKEEQKIIIIYDLIFHMCVNIWV